ncbi:MAG: LysR family transcriptional regulator [Bacteroidales bacterium]|jgi:DNA-binding transcriptional LysR family regulator|nr:LysR family transcriptional regulator [Bacteroidales bacterium]
MNNLWVKYFIAVIDNDLNFTKASKSMCISQPALSKHINDLGKELEVKLFDTSRKNTPKLTPGGKLLYQFFSEYNNKLKETIMAAKALNDQETGELKIAVTNDWDISDLHKKIDAFGSKYPNISITIESMGFNAIKKGLFNNSYDIVITTKMLFAGIQEVNSKDLFFSPRLLLYSYNHGLAKKTGLDITDFKDDILYTFSPEVDPNAKEINEQYCKSKGFIPIIKTVSNFESILLAIEAGRGFTIVSKWNRIVNNKGFKYIELDDNIVFCAVWKKDNNNSALRLFCNECLDNIKCFTKSS